MSTSKDLFAVESPKYVRVDEGVHWSLDTTNYGGSPTSVSVAVYDADDADTDVTSATMPGSATVSSDTIQLPEFQSADKGNFRVMITFSNARFTPARVELDVVVVR